MDEKPKEQEERAVETAKESGEKDCVTVVLRVGKLASRILKHLVRLSFSFKVVWHCADLQRKARDNVDT